jgi:hypothetical protein
LRFAVHVRLDVTEAQVAEKIYMWRFPAVHFPIESLKGYTVTPLNAISQRTRQGLCHFTH